MKCKYLTIRSTLILIVMITITTFTMVANGNSYKESNENDDDYDDDGDFHQLIIFAISGLSGSSSGSRFMPFVNEMSSLHGAHTSKARTVSSTYSLPGWIGHFYAATPAEYGCLTYDCPLPSEKSGHRSLLDILQYDHNYAISIHSNDYPEESNIIKKSLMGKYPVKTYPLSDRDAMMKAGKEEKYLPQTDKRVLIFHFHGLEFIASSMGYDSHNYRGHVTCIDEQIKQITESLWNWEEEYSTFLVISDHGGKGYHHEYFNTESIQVPIAMWGYGIREKINLFTKSVDTTQVAPTILNCLNYNIPEEWIHPPLRQIKMPDPDDLVSYSYYDYSNETHPMTNVYDSNEYCIVPFTSKHHHIDNIKVIFIILFVISFLVMFLFLYLLDNPNVYIDW